MTLSERVIESYDHTHSLKFTAAKYKISIGKVRKILLTAGIVPDNPMTIMINNLYCDGLTVE